jgi:hypothetical protein
MHVVLEDRAQIQLVLDLEAVADPFDDRMIGDGRDTVSHTELVTGVGVRDPANFRRLVEEAAAQDFRVLGPCGPAGNRATKAILQLDNNLGSNCGAGATNGSILAMFCGVGLLGWVLTRGESSGSSPGEPVGAPGDGHPSG